MVCLNGALGFPALSSAASAPRPDIVGAWGDTEMEVIVAE